MSGHGATVPIQSVKACVVYDAHSGHIHHKHSVITLQGGAAPSEDQIAGDALRAARGRAHPPGGELAVLHVDHQELSSGQRHKVDVATRTLAPY